MFIAHKWVNDKYMTYDFKTYDSRPFHSKKKMKVENLKYTNCQMGGKRLNITKKSLFFDYKFKVSKV